MTALPASAAAMAISAWRSFGTQMSTRSMSGRAIELAPVGFDALVAPAVGEGLRLRFVAAAGGLEHRAAREVEEVRGGAEGVGMAAAHEAVADHADVEVPGHRPHSVQPWASRTLTMAARTLFQVCLVLHDRVRQHAGVPADVAHRLCQVAVLVAEPVAGVLDRRRAARRGRRCGSGGRSSRGRRSRRRCRRSGRRGSRGSRGGARRRPGGRRRRAPPCRTSRSPPGGCGRLRRCSRGCRASSAPCRPGSRPGRAGRRPRGGRAWCARSACRPSRSRPRRR